MKKIQNLAYMHIFLPPQYFYCKHITHYSLNTLQKIEIFCSLLNKYWLAYMHTSYSNFKINKLFVYFQMIFTSLCDDRYVRRVLLKIWTLAAKMAEGK